MKTSPTQRSLAHLRKEGWTAGVVERWIEARKIRIDFCGGIDLIAFAPDKGILGVQCCAASGLAAHRKKLLAEPRMKLWVESGAGLVIHAWRKTNERKPGKRKTWKVLEERFVLAHFTPLVQDADGPDVNAAP